MKRRKEGYHSAEARAGHDYNISAKHRERESEGMRKKTDKKYYQTPKDRHDESKAMRKK